MYYVTDDLQVFYTDLDNSPTYHVFDDWKEARLFAVKRAKEAFEEARSTLERVLSDVHTEPEEDV